MNDYPYLTFSLNNSLYGVSTSLVREIFSLPELTVIPKTPPDLIGVVNLRGEILPVFDLNVCFGYQPLEYKLTDSVIVLQWESTRIGVIVNQVYDVKPIEKDKINNNLNYGYKENKERKNIGGIAKHKEGLIILIDSQTIIVKQQEILDKYDDWLYKQINDYSERKMIFQEKQLFCPHATPEERKIFSQRANSLAKLTDTEDLEGLIPLALVTLNQEVFGIDLNLVKEFTDLKKITPIPCCPSHIVGNMNLRGEILTIININQFLNLSLNNKTNQDKAIVVKVKDITVGVMVEEVKEIAFIHSTQISTTPTSIQAIDDNFLKGVIPYKQQLVTLINLEKLLLEGQLFVEEFV